MRYLAVGMRASLFKFVAAGKTRIRKVCIEWHLNSLIL